MGIAPVRPDSLRPHAPSATYERLGSPLAWSLVLVGIALRLHQFLFNRSLFVDEAALALNLRDRGLLELVAPLDHAQAAPIGYLFLQKALFETAGGSEYVLRAVPLLAGIAALPLFLILARRVLDARVVTAAVALFALSEYQIFWATDIKPYAIDVLACLLLLLASLSWLDRRNARAARRLALTGALLPWFSHASVLVMAGCAVVLAADALRGTGPDERAARNRLARVALVWLAAVPAIAHAGISLSPESKAYFDAFWHEGFLPLPVSAESLGRWWWVLQRWLFDPLGLRAPWGWPFLAAAAAGTVALLRRRGPHPRHEAAARPVISGALVLAPVAVVVLASVAGSYPLTARWTYSGRVVLFIAPILYLAACAGLAFIRPRFLTHAAGTLLVATAAIPAVAGLPYSRGEIRPALAYVEARARPDDVVYLYYAARLATEYYAPAIRAEVVHGVCAQADRRRYLADLESLRGRRVWLVMAYDLYAEHPLFLDYMARNATPLDSIPLPTAEARLYDFPPAPAVAPTPALLDPIVRPDARTDCVGVFATP